MSLRNGFYAWLLLALVCGLYLYRLWQPERQVNLHSEHLLRALEQTNWSKVAGSIDPTYADRWGHDRDLILLRLHAVLPYARQLHFEVIAPAVQATTGEGKWRARIAVEADPNEVTALIKAHLNTLDAPFELDWHRVGKPWAWKLVRVENAALELPSDPP